MDIGSYLEHKMQGHFDAPKADTHGAPKPQPGDAVLLTGPWFGAKVGQVGVIDGIIGRAPEDLEITFNPSAFRDDQSVSVSGGPGTMGLEASRLKPTGRKHFQSFWRWKKGELPGAGNSEYYQLEVPLWEWDGQD